MVTSANDKLADATRRHFIDLTKYDAGLRRKVLKRLKTLENELVAKIAISGYDKNGLEKLKTKRYKKFLQEVKDTISTSYSDIKQINNTESIGLAGVESRVTANKINNVLGVKDAVPMLNETALKQTVSNVLIQGAPINSWFDRQSRDLKEKFSDAMRNGLLTGETNQKLIQAVRGTRAGGFKDGIMNASRNKASTLVRTEVNAISNNARIATYKDNEDIVDKMVTFVTFDSRTSDICIGRSGLEYTVDGDPIGHNVDFDGGPPYHPNCRTIMSPVLKSYADLGIDKNEIPKGTRASIDGQVPEDLSYNAWLKTKSNKEQNEILGVGKAELFRADKITTRQLINNDGNPLTLKQLEAKSK